VSKNNDITRAISIRQPYVEQILQGEKVNEYRSRPTNIRERVYLYASQKPADGYDVGDLPRGLIVGTVEIIDCRWDDGEGCYAYVLANPRRLRQPLKPTNHPQPVWFRPF
jgi:hypothetical protein